MLRVLFCTVLHLKSKQLLGFLVGQRVVIRSIVFIDFGEVKKMFLADDDVLMAAIRYKTALFQGRLLSIDWSRFDAIFTSICGLICMLLELIFSP